MNQKEKELFLELCAFRDPNAKKIESLIGADAATPEVLGMLFANRMAGVAYHVLKEIDLLHLPDREFRNSLRNAAEQNEKINQDFIGCIKFGVDIFKASKIANEFECAFFSNTCNTGDVVGFVAHDRLDIHKLSGVNSIVVDKFCAVKVYGFGICAK